MIADHRWEPSSSVGSTWVHSFSDPTAWPAGRTSSWNGSAWATPVTHNWNANASGDLFLSYDSVRSRHVLVWLDLTSHAIVYRSSQNSTGASWNNPVMTGINTAGDYPSVAVSSTGTIVVGANLASGLVTGFQVTRSTDGGATWNNTRVVVSGQDGANARIVASGTTFYIFFATNSTLPTVYLKYISSTDGINWNQPVQLDMSTAPKRYSSTSYCLNFNCGPFHYATNLDAAGSAGPLGWVVIYPVKSAVGNLNYLKFCAQNLGGCVTISYNYDLFLQGIATSATGDIWMNYHTYGVGGTLPLLLLAAYRTPGGSYLTSVYQSPSPNEIDPRYWDYAAPGPAAFRCNPNPLPPNPTGCFSAGDYMKPGMNTFSGATLPFVRRSSVINDLAQLFVQDPPVGLPPVPGLQFSEVQPFGSDSRSREELSPEQIRERTPSLSPSWAGRPNPTKLGTQ